MTFDLTTLLFQLANFALLIVLLRVFLYRPVLKVMDEREELTAAPLREARRLVEEAEQERESLRQQRAHLEHERVEVLTVAARGAEELREQRLEELDRESSRLREVAAESVEREVERISDRLLTSLGHIVVDEVRQTLAVVAGSELEALTWARFTEQLQALSTEQRVDLTSAAAGGVTVVTPRELSSQTTETARRTLAELLGATNVTFETDPELLLGVALVAGGMRLDGTAAARLESLDSTFAEVVRTATS